LLDDLIVIQDKIPDYWQKIIRNLSIIENIDNFFKFLKEQPRNLDNEQCLKKLNLTYILFFSQTKEFILRKIILDTTLSITNINHALLLKLMKHRPELSKDFFNILFNSSNKPYQLFLDLLFKKNSENSNLLMAAGRYHTDTIKLILYYLNLYRENIEKEKISALFFSQNNDGWNLFSLAARHLSDAIQCIFDFLSKNPCFDNEISSIIFHQKIDSKCNFLQLLVRYQSEDQVNICLDFISEKFQFSNNKKWLEIISNKAH
jgi:hypothetical protein